MADYLVSFIIMKNNLEAKSGIYKITINDYYIYIGQSNCLRYRINIHIKNLKDNKHCNKKFQNVFNKYPNTIKFEVIEYCDIDMLDEREMFYIDYYKSYNTKHGLNMSIGGDCGCRKYKTKEEVKAVKKERFEKWYRDNKEYYKKYNKQYRENNKDRCKEKCKEYRRKKGVLSKKERFEKHYSLNRALTNEEWNIWRTDKSISGSHDKPYAIKYLKTLPNLTFVVP